MLRAFARRTLLLAAAATLAPAGVAAAAVTQLGPRPDEGGAGGINGTVSPSVVRAGESQTVTMNTSWSTFYSPNAEFGPVIVRTSAMNVGAGTITTPFCFTTLYFAGSVSCEVTRGSATGSWATAGFTITLNNGNSATYRTPYAVLPPNTYNIGGKFSKRTKTTTGAARDEPVAGIEVVVEEVGGTEKYTVTTGNQGQYDVQVGKGTWRVRPLDRSFCHDTGGAGGGGCSRAPTATTPGDKTINFIKPGPINVSGSVKTKDGAAVFQAKVRARQTDDDGEVSTYEAVTDKDGNYAMEGLLPNVPVTFDSPVPYICPITPGADPKIGSNSECEEKKREVPGSESDLTQDFQKPGCFTEIDFESSMKARSRCFKLTAGETWETDEPFRLDGIDFTPKDGQKVTFDKQARTVDFGTGAFTVSLEKSAVSRVLPPVSNLGLVRFESTTAKFSWAADISLPKIKQFGGWPISGQITATLTSGASELAFKVKAPKDPANQYQWLFNDFGEDAETIAIEVKIAADMDGARGLEGTIEDAIDNKLFALKSASLGYDWPDGAWTLKGTVEPKFAKKPGPQVANLPGIAAKQFTGSISATGIPLINGGSFTKFSASGDGLNVSIADGFFLQRAGLGFEFGGFTRNTRGKAAANLGFTFGPQLSSAKTLTIPTIPGVTRQDIEVTVIPKELVSLDGDGSVEWSTADDNTFGKDVKIELNAGMKLWDQPIGQAEFKLWPRLGLGSIGLKRVGIIDPTGGSLFSLQGSAEGTVDTRGKARFFINGRGQASVGRRGGQVEFFLTGPNPTVLAFCGRAGSTNIGGALNFDDILATPPVAEGGACDLGPFRAARPKPPEPVDAPTPPPYSSGADQNTPSGARARRERLARRASGLTQRFTATGTEGTIPVQLTTTSTAPGFPNLKITGPGLSATVTDGEIKGGGKLDGFVFAAQGRAVLLFTKARKGTYTISVTDKRGLALDPPMFSQVLDTPQVQTGLDRSQCSPVIHWTAEGITGQQLRFVEDRPDGTQSVVGTTTKKQGKLAVTPLPGNGSVELFVEVVNGTTVRTRQSIGAYTSQAGPNVPGPGNVSVRKAKGKGKQSTVSWTGVCGAESYSVVVSQGKTAGKPISVRGTSVTIPRPRPGAKITVTSLGRDGVPGGSTLIPVG